MIKVLSILLWLFIVMFGWVFSVSASSDGWLWESQDCICTMEFDPVCWIDGRTYSNPCVASCDAVEISYKGECSSYIHLTVAHETLIEEIVNKWLLTASHDDIDAVIQKVADKTDDINYTLSVSSFIQWSPALIKYQFVLEILRKVHSLML